MSADAPKIQDWVIDTDTHITEPGDLWTSRLPAKYKDRAPHIVRDSETGVDTWRIGDSGALMPVGYTATAGWREPFPAAPRNMDEVPKASYDPVARLEFMDRVGIWATTLYPNVGGFGSQAFLGLKDPELMLACVRAYNDFLIDWVSPDPRRLIPILATPFWDVEASVEEVERCAKLGHKGVLFTGEPQSHDMPILASSHWNPLWEVAQACDLPVSFHIGTGTFDDGFTPERIEMTGPGRTNGFAATSLFLDNGKQLADLLFSGILPRFPELKFLSVEAGIGFIPFILESCDYTFEYGQVRSSNPEFELKPSEYFARQVYGCYIFEEFAPSELLDAIGVDNVLFETDYPHPVCLHDNVREKIDAGLGGVSREAQRKVLFENAAKLYKVETPDVPPPVPVG
ncbi:MAG: amidohydrolase [Deltaproteobacteria bacterium]|jgi:predicted TIM-barrel fold metal-dependent hydrolase|nr:amidohydrolase [Deltaproteobacteria bacterium]